MSGSWARIDRGFYKHRKVEKCSNGAIGLWAKANAWCRDNRSAGVIPSDVVLQLGTAAEAAELVAANLWIRQNRDGQWVAVFKDYQEWNSDVEADTEAGNLVRKLVPESHPSAVRSQLVRQTYSLLKEGISADVIEAGLKLWLSKDLSPNLLPSLVSQAMRDAQYAATVKNTIKQCLETGTVSPLRNYGHVFIPPDTPPDMSIEECREFMAAAKREWLNDLLKKVA